MCRVFLLVRCLFRYAGPSGKTDTPDSYHHDKRIDNDVRVKLDGRTGPMLSHCFVIGVASWLCIIVSLLRRKPSNLPLQFTNGRSQ